MVRIAGDGLSALARFAFYGEVDNWRQVEAQLDITKKERGDTVARRAILSYLEAHLDPHWEAEVHAGMRADYRNVFPGDDPSPVAVAHMDDEQAVWDEAEMAHGLFQDGDDDGEMSPADVEVNVDYLGKGRVRVRPVSNWQMGTMRTIRLTELLEFFQRVTIDADLWR